MVYRLDPQLSHPKLHTLYPLLRKGTVTTNVEDIFVETNSKEQMDETLRISQTTPERKPKSST